MKFQVPTAWLPLVVRKTVRQLNDDGTVGSDVICRWDGQDVVLKRDPSPETDIDRTFLARLNVGDRVLVKGNMTVQHIPDNTSTALHVSLFVQTAKEHPGNGFNSDSDSSSSSNSDNGSNSGSDNSNNDNDSNSDSGSNSNSDSSNSDSDSNSDSSSNSSSDSDSGSSSDSDSGSGSNSDSGSGSNNGSSSDNESFKVRSRSVHLHNSDGSKPKEETDCRRKSKRRRLSTSTNDNQGQIAAYADPDGENSRENAIVRYTGVREGLSHRIQGAGMAGSAPRVYPPSFNTEEGGLQVSDTEFNGRGQPVTFRQPVRGIHEPNLVYSFIQKFSDGSRREICVATRMAAQESVDTLVVYENVFGDVDTGVCVLGRVLR